ncbi:MULTISPECIES: nSTAND1 domain-containing NTPase [unclassified Nostoc]|uniref:nSTAND1 domain-containing NTPase n=1 Tax=unclassified Nostoc TaxID=2593658 RepID=UPI0026016CBD|nr:caspase family protein [Nostoc sp. S13]MDF5739916.1 caspase family protein [Nostoc sp. S13]
MSKHNFNLNFAIIIGINKYINGIRELETAVPDAHKLAQIIQKQHQNLKQQYQVQNKYEVQLLLNQRVTLSKLKELIEDFKQGQIPFDNEKVVVTESDRVLLYFAGHGIALEALENQEGPVGYLIPQDATLGDSSTYLPMQELHDALNALPCRHMLAILDCCFAGAFRWASLKREILPKVTVYKERYDRFISDAAWQVITSAADDQKALDSLGVRGEVKEGNEIHSPFAKALFDALRGTDKKADSNDDGIITATELYSYLRDQVEVVTEKNYKRQTPSLCPLRKHDKGEFIFLLPNFDRDKLEDAPPLNLENNPYRGLQSYDEKDNNLFFGRENLIKQLYQQVVSNKQTLTVVLGASGTGKSSLMKAGLLHRLRHSQEYKFQILDPMRPGESPLQALAQVCLPIANTITAVELAKDEQALANIVSKINPQIKLLLAIDQFEELITLCKRDEEREQFQKLIKNAIAKYPHSIHVVITLRQDFEGQFQNSILKDFWNDDTRFVVPPMTQDEFREAIEKPASEKVVYFDPPSLVDELINEVVQMPGALPLLSFTLSELYLKYLAERRDNRALKKEDYEELGRVVGSLTKRANQEYDQLVAKDPAYENTVRQVMLRMISLQGGDLARRQVPKSELIYPDKQESDRVQIVIKRFSEARLIIEGSNSQGEPYVEPAHDALVQGWDKLLKWKKEEEEDIILQRRLTPAAEEWKSVASKEQPLGLQAKAETVIDRLDSCFYVVENLSSKFSKKIITWLFQGLQQRQHQQEGLREKPKQFLWNSNPYLDVLNQELQSHDNWFNKLETEFVQQSVLQKRRDISWGWRIAIAIMLGLSGLTVWALINLRQATINQMLSEKESADADLRSNQLILDALLNSLSAGESLKNRWLLKVPPPKEDEQLQVIRTLRKAVYTVKEYNRQEGFPSGVQSIFWEKDGRRRLLVVSTENDGTVRVWDKQAKKLAELPGNQYLVTQVIFSPDGRQLAIGTNKGTILFWDWQNQQQATVLQGHRCEDTNDIPSFNSCAITSLSFNQDGSQLISVQDDGIASLWNFTSNQYQELQVPPNNIIMTGGFQPNGKLLLVTKTPDGKSVSVFNSSFQELSKIDKQFPVMLDQVILSPNSEEIAIIYGGGRSIVGSESYLWQWRQNYSRQLLGQNIDINFSQDGKKLAAAGFNDGTIRLQDLDSGIISQLKGHKGQIANFNFRSDGKVLATASADGTLRLWSMEEQQPSQLKILPEKINSITFSGDGKLIATQAVDGVVHLLDLSGKPVKQFNSQLPVFNSLGFSPNGRQLATLSQEGTVGILDLSSQQYREFLGKYDSNSNLSFSPDGKHIAVTGYDNNSKVYLLNVSSGKPNDKSFPYEETIRINNVIWKSDDQILLAGVQQLSRAYKSIVLLDVKSGKQLQTIPRDQGIGELYNISSNSDGSLAAFVQQDGTVSLWYMDGTKLGEFKDLERKTKSVILSPDSSMVATISEDGTAKLWEIGKLDKLLAKGCDRLGEYLQNNPNQSDRHLCDNLPSTPANPHK